MSLFGIFSKPALIVKEDLHTGEVEVSPDFDSVAAANHGLSSVLKDPDIIVYDRGINDYDGATAEAAVRQEDPTIFHDTHFEVFPVDTLE